MAMMDINFLLDTILQQPVSDIYMDCLGRKDNSWSSCWCTEGRYRFVKLLLGLVAFSASKQSPDVY